MKRNLVVLAALVAATAVVVIVASGGEEVRPIEAGALAESVPDSAQGYGEIVLDHPGELADQVRGLVEAAGGSDADLSEIGDGFASEFEGEDGSTLDFETIDGWLGSRAAGFVLDDLAEVPVADGEIQSDGVATAAVIAIDDADEAREAMEDLFGPSVDTEEDALYTGDGDPKVVLLDDRLLIGSAEAVDAALGVPTGSSLANQNWFQESLESVGGPDSLGFMVGEGSALTALMMRQGGERFAKRFGPLLVDSIDTVDLTQPYSFDFGVSDGGFAIDVGYGVGEGIDLAKAERELGDLPADSWLAVNDPLLTPIYLDSFTTGVKLGLEREEVSRIAVAEKLGYDPIASMESLTGQTALFAAGEVSGDLRAGAFLELGEAGRGVYPVDAVRFLLGTLDPEGFEAKPLRVGGPWAFTTSIGDGPFEADLAATEVDNRLGVVSGYPPEQLMEAFDPPERLAGSERFTEASERLGDDYRLLGFADLEKGVQLGSLLDPSIAGALATDQTAAEFLREADLVLGAFERSGRVELRYLIATG